MATCRSCGARIEWGLTPSGKKLPLDAAPDRERGTVLLRGGYAVTLVGAELEAARRFRHDLYVSHYATCPQGSVWKRR